LLRVKLLYVDEAEHLLILTTHNIVFDGWSHDVFLRELVALYEAFSTGIPSPLPELSIQYVDFAVWQRQWLQGEVLEQLLSYWKQHLDGCPAMLELPTDRSRQRTSTSRSSRHSLALPQGLTEALNALSQREGVTLFMTLLAAFKTLLHRYTGQEDIILGSPSAGRDPVDTEGLIGFFVNTLVLRTDLAGSPTFRELLSRVREVCLGAYAYQALPFERLVEELQPERDLHRNPLFQIFFNFVRFRAQQTHLEGLTVNHIFRSVAESKFDLTLYAQEQDSQIQFELVYKTDLFEPSRMVEMLEQLKQLLQQVVENAAQPITSYSLVTPRAAPLLPDPRVTLPEPLYASVTQLFASLAECLPEQPAVRQGDHTWTYKALLYSATTLARVLLASGLNRGEVVAVVGSKCFGLFASVIGVLMSGGVLLTVDATLPTPRKQLMLREAAVKHLVWLDTRHPEGDEVIQALTACDIVHMEPDTGRTVEASKFLTLEAISLPHLTPDDAAYVFFTSGTTGVPKGILGSHKGLNHFLNWQRETFEVGPRDHCAQLTTLSFDALLRDIFLPLTSGALLCVPEEDNLRPPQIWEWLEHQQISLLHAVPTVVQFWLADVPAHVSLCALRWVFFSGEPLTDTFVHQWRMAFPETEGIVNFYGPTETTMIKCFNLLLADLNPGVQPIGRPLPETQALVLGQHNQLCGIGELGFTVLHGRLWAVPSRWQSRHPRAA
jgi:non-ribosomal peptide synthetase component F